MQRNKKPVTRPGGDWRDRSDLVAQWAAIDGWPSKVNRVVYNESYVVAIRQTPGNIVHLAIKRMRARAEPTWRELQTIKDEIAGPERTAIQIYPRRSRVVDNADAYHLFVLPAGAELGFGIHHLDGPF